MKHFLIPFAAHVAFLLVIGLFYDLDLWSYIFGFLGFIVMDAADEVVSCNE